MCEFEATQNLIMVAVLFFLNKKNRIYGTVRFQRTFKAVAFFEGSQGMAHGCSSGFIGEVCKRSSKGRARSR